MTRGKTEVTEKTAAAPQAAETKGEEGLTEARSVGEPPAPTRIQALEHTGTRLQLDPPGLRVASRSCDTAP